MLYRARVVLPAALVSTALAGCGDNAAPPLPPLVADPAVEVGCTARPGPGVTRAKQVACADELVPGRLASGRPGDLLLENERVRVIVRAPGQGYYLHGSGGGGIVDAAVVGGEDLIKELLPVVDLSAGAFDELAITEAGDDGPAEVVLRGPATGLDLVRALGTPVAPVIIEHHLRLAAGSDAVELTTRLYPQPGSEPATREVFDGAFFGARARWFVPGEGWDGTGPSEIIATAGTTTSYALVAPPRTSALRRIGVGSIAVVRGAAISDQPATRWLVLGDGSVASVTEKAWTLRGVPLGVIRGDTAPGATVVVAAGTAPTTLGRADASGHYRLAVPAGTYALRAEAAGREPGAAVPVTVAAGADVVAAVPAGPGGALDLTVVDERGVGLPARVALEQTGRDRRLTWTDGDGHAHVPLEPGAWRVTVSRGLEYDAWVAADVAITDGASTPLAATLERVLDTTGWLALDPHLHSEMSNDSTLPVDDRLRAVAGEGVELPVSSDHDMVTDYRPVIAELGLGDWLGTVAGAEVSSLVWGHLNGYPQTLAPERTGGGAARWQGRAPGAVFAAMHDGGAGLVQVNHPRRDGSGLFDAIDLDAATLTARRDPAALGLPDDTDLSDLGFDAIEVANGGSTGDFEAVFADWLAMVAAGHPAAATGSSDSHGAAAFAGAARTYVWVGVGADAPGHVDADALIDAIRGRHVVVGTGAFVTAGVVTASGTSRPGDTVDVRGQAAVTLRVTVQAPPWQPLAELRVYQGRALVRTMPLDPAATEAVRFDADITLPTPTADTFYVVRVEPAGPGSPVLATTMPAFTNPLFVTVGP